MCFCLRDSHRVKDSTTPGILFIPEEVPILFAGKIYGKTTRWEFGALTAICDSAGDTTDFERFSIFNAVRYKRVFLKNSEIGFIFATKEEKKSFNRVFDIDGAFRFYGGQFIYQTIFTQKDSFWGYAFQYGFRAYLPSIAIISRLSYAVGDTSYFNWSILLFLLKINCKLA